MAIFLQYVPCLIMKIFVHVVKHVNRIRPKSVQLCKVLDKTIWIFLKATNDLRIQFSTMNCREISEKREWRQLFMSAFNHKVIDNLLYVSESAQIGRKQWVRAAINITFTNTNIRFLDEAEPLSDGQFIVRILYHWNPLSTYFMLSYWISKCQDVIQQNKNQFLLPFLFAFHT